MARRAIAATLLATGLFGLGVLALAGRTPSEKTRADGSRGPSATVPEVASAPAPQLDPTDPGPCEDRPLSAPSGLPAKLTCAEARQVVAQVRERLAAPVPAPAARAFGDAVVDWLDPHGLWSAPPDVPTHVAFRKLSAALLREIQLPPGDARGCAAASELGRATSAWVIELREILERARAAAPDDGIDRAFTLASEGVFEDNPVTRSARELARDLGLRIGAFERVWGDAEHAVQQAEARLLPDLGDDGWTGAILAAALRAYVPAVDPHGQWAPLDEEWSLYASDPALDAEPRLWGRMERTALGVRLSEDATRPLLEGDLVLSVAGTPTAGLSVEQVEQLSHLALGPGESAQRVVVLRRGERAPRVLEVERAEATESDAHVIAEHRVPFADGEVLVLAVPGVPEGLGEELERVVARHAEAPVPPLGILLDLRGNGGGSIDGAAAAIGVFLPGAPSFPLRRRDGQIEVQHAGVPATSGRWRGPVAALVDGDTASAAEMIAGAIASYRRGPVLGTRTFGKGCVQEYFDDCVGGGVLRLTTMLFALPDGAPLQGIGLTPTLPLALPSGTERERAIPGALASWRGPDVRTQSAMGGPDWPSHSGRVGPCEDGELCVALRRLGAVATARRAAARPPRRTGL